MKSIALATCLFAMPFYVSAAHICWVDSVETHEDGLHVIMKDGYQHAARQITHADKTTSSVTFNPDGSFTIGEGESSLLSTLPHDACFLQALKKQGNIGVQLSATTCMPNPAIGCIKSEEFVQAK